jgi:hypothetical protein
MHKICGRCCNSRFFPSTFFERGHAANVRSVDRIYRVGFKSVNLVYRELRRPGSLRKLGLRPGARWSLVDYDQAHGRHFYR